jgi:hypothetical protein
MNRINLLRGNKIGLSKDGIRIRTLFLKFREMIHRRASNKREGIIKIYIHLVVASQHCPLEQQL